MFVHVPLVHLSGMNMFIFIFLFRCTKNISYIVIVCYIVISLLTNYYLYINYIYIYMQQKTSFPPILPTFCWGGAVQDLWFRLCPFTTHGLSCGWSLETRSLGRPLGCQSESSTEGLTSRYQWGAENVGCWRIGHFDVFPASTGLVRSWED